MQCWWKMPGLAFHTHKGESWRWRCHTKVWFWQRDKSQPVDVGLHSYAAAPSEGVVVAMIFSILVSEACRQILSSAFIRCGFHRATLFDIYSDTIWEMCKASQSLKVYLKNFLSSSKMLCHRKFIYCYYDMSLKIIKCSQFSKMS